MNAPRFPRQSGVVAHGRCVEKGQPELIRRSPIGRFPYLSPNCQIAPLLRPYWSSNATSQRRTVARTLRGIAVRLLYAARAGGAAPESGIIIQRDASLRCGTPCTPASEALLKGKPACPSWAPLLSSVERGLHNPGRSYPTTTTFL
jgi:hypothetical protein